jgi:hypothetical protein
MLTKKARLVACPACARHVRADARACPFCVASLPESFGAGPAPKPPPARLTRAELYAFGTVGALAVAACGSEVILVNANDAGTDAEGLDRDAYTIEPPYGGVPACGPNTYPCPDGGSVDGNEASSEASSNDAVCNACVPYGLPGFGGPPERD